MSPELTAALRAETPSAPAELRERVALIAASPPRLARTSTCDGRSCGRARGRCLLARRCRRRRSRHLVHPPPSASTPSAVQNLERKVAPSRAREGQRDSVTLAPATERRAAVPAPSRRRAQDVQAELRVLVDNPNDLSAATQRALRTTRRLGGYVVTVNYGTPEPTEGTATPRPHPGVACPVRDRPVQRPRPDPGAADADHRPPAAARRAHPTDPPDEGQGARQPFGASASSSTAAPRTRRSTWP